VVRPDRLRPLLPEPVSRRGDLCRLRRGSTGRPGRRRHHWWHCQHRGEQGNSTDQHQEASSTLEQGSSPSSDPDQRTPDPLRSGHAGIAITRRRIRVAARPPDGGGSSTAATRAGAGIRPDQSDGSWTCKAAPPRKAAPAVQRGMSLGWRPSTRCIQLGHTSINRHKLVKQLLNMIYACLRSVRTTLD